MSVFGTHGSNVTGTIAGNKASCRGGGGCVGMFVNCVITNNTAVYKGGGVYNGACYNTFFAYNSATAAAGLFCGDDCPDGYGCAVNCTFTRNPVSEKSTAGFTGVPLVVNCISWGHVYQKQVMPDSCTVCSNSCVASLSATTSSGVISTDPRLDADFRPHARACKNAGVVHDWMTDADDVRSKDLAGNARIIGEKPDMGAFECEPTGLTLLVR